jgi:hypothetical protein
MESTLLDGTEYNFRIEERPLDIIDLAIDNLIVREQAG